MNTVRLPILLVAQDNLGDRALLQEAFEVAGMQADLRFVKNGDECLDYLHRRPPWEKRQRPDLILLDLTIPRMSSRESRESLLQIKTNPQLKSIPVVVLSSSHTAEDLAQAYADGANTCIPKPEAFDELVYAVRVMCEFWTRVSVLPSR